MGKFMTLLAMFIVSTWALQIIARRFEHPSESAIVSPAVGACLDVMWVAIICIQLWRAHG